MKIKFLLFVTLFVACVSNYAQSVDDVTLVVNGSGATKEDAVHTALRGAIEQAFGVFVSANTSIVNDELVKDEIATVTSGNVKSFTELESVALPNGNFAVTLQAVVSTQKLVAYAKSKGSSCEFAGATFGANLKLLKLNQINTEKAFDNLMIQLETISPYIFDYNFELGQPTKVNVYQHPSGRIAWGDINWRDWGYTCIGDSGCVSLTLNVTSNDNTYAFTQLLKTTIQALSLKKEQVSEVEALGENTFKLALSEISKYGDEDKISFEFYSAFPIERLSRIIKNARNGYIVTSDIGHMFDFIEKKKDAYGGSLCVNDGCIVIPKFNKSKVKKTKTDKKSEQEHTPQRQEYQQVELYTFNTDLLMPVGDLTKISKFEVVKVSWIDFLKEQMQEDPKNKVYYENFISLCVEKDMYEELMVLIDTDEKRTREEQIGYYGFLTRNLGKKGEVDFLKWCVERTPENQFFYEQLISICETEEFITFANEMITRTQYPTYYYMKGRFYQKKYAYKEAIEEYKKVIELDVANVDAYQNLGICYLKGRDESGVWGEQYRLAAQMFEKLRVLDDGTDPSREAVWSFGLEKCYHYLLDYDKASEFKKIYSKHYTGRDPF